MGARRKKMRTLGGTGAPKSQAQAAKQKQRKDLKTSGGAKNKAGGGDRGAPKALTRKQKKHKRVIREQSAGVQVTAARRLGLGRDIETADDATDEGSLGIEGDVAFFSDRIELVPIQHLLPPEEEDEAAIISSKFMKNAKRNAPKQAVKEATKKAKRNAKFTDAPKTHMDLIKEHSEKLAESTRDQFAAPAKDEEATGDEPKPWGSTAPARSISELKERLHAKMGQLREKRAQNAERKPRADKRPKKNQDTNISNDSDSPDSGPDADADADEAAERKLREQVAASISFGGVISDAADANTAKGKRVKTRNLLDVKRMLRKAEENKAVLEELKSSSNVEDRERAKDQLWDQIEDKAKGALLPEPKHLRKIAKRLEKKKQKSADEWAKRKQQVEDAKTERLDKRDANVAQAKQRRVDNKLRRKGIVLDKNEPAKEKSAEGDTAKPARNRAGFEGRRSGFINDKAKRGKAK